MDASGNPTIGDLKRIRSLSQFSDQQLAGLAEKLQFEPAGIGECLTDFGCTENYSLYLLDGTLMATAKDERQHRHEASTGGELLPIAKIRPSI